MEKLPPPTFSPPSGIFDDVSELDVEIAAPNNLDIFYTTDGSEPKLVHYNSRPLGHKGCPWRNTFHPPISVKISIPGQIQAVTFAVRDGKAVFSDVSTATYAWTKIQIGTILSCSPQSKPHSWNVFYSYTDDDGQRRETSVFIGDDIPGWAFSDDLITVPGSGFSGFVKLLCPEQVAWSTFGKFGNGNQAKFFLAAQ